MKTARQFLEEMYLPGYMAILSEDYQGKKAWFDFKPVEPQVTVLSDIYLTPRGAHILLSQSSYCFSERLIDEEGIIAPEELQVKGHKGRLKLVEFNQRFRREIPLTNNLQGRLVLTTLRYGKMPLVKMDFDLGNRSITGNLIGVIAPKPISQANGDFLRNK